MGDGKFTGVADGGVGGGASRPTLSAARGNGIVICLQDYGIPEVTEI